MCNNWFQINKFDFESPTKTRVYLIWVELLLERNREKTSGDDLDLSLIFFLNIFFAKLSKTYLHLHKSLCAICNFSVQISLRLSQIPASHLLLPSFFIISFLLSLSSLTNLWHWFYMTSKATPFLCSDHLCFSLSSLPQKIARHCLVFLFLLLPFALLPSSPLLLSASFYMSASMIWAFEAFPCIDTLILLVLLLRFDCCFLCINPWLLACLLACLLAMGFLMPRWCCGEERWFLWILVLLFSLDFL